MVAFVEDIMEIQFNNGLIPAIVQDYNSGKVLMLAYMNEESLKKLWNLEQLGFGVDLEISSGTKEKPQDIFNM